MGRSLAALMLSCGLSVALAAQQTWIVDPNGTGHFTDLAVAIATANAGDTIEFRGGGDYTGLYALSGKALHFRGDPANRPRINHVQVGSVAFVSFRHVDIRNVRSSSPTTFEDVELTQLWSTDARVHLHDCTIGGAFDIWGATNVGYALYLDGGDVTITDSTLHGSHGYFWQTLVCTVYPGSPPIETRNAVTVTVSDCALFGADSVSTFCGPTPAGPAVSVGFGGSVRVTRSTLTGGLGANNVRYQPVAVSLSTFQYDPSVGFTPANTVGAVTFLPGTGGQSALPGGVMTCRAESGPNLGAALVASLGMPGPIPVPEGLAFVDPSAFVVLRIGVTDPTGFLNATIPIPAWAPRGLLITAQSVVAASATAPLVAGAPVVLHVL